MAWKLLIDGVDKTGKVLRNPGLSYTRTLNERSTMKFTVGMNYLPAKNKEVFAYEDDGVTHAFGGLITNRALQGWDPVEREFIVNVTCSDFLSLLDGFFVTLPAFTAATVKTVLTAFVAALPGSYSITLSGSQVDGATVTVGEAANMRATDYLRQLATITTGLTDGNMVIRMNTSRVLDMYTPGGVSAPFAITEAITEANTHAEQTYWRDSTKPYATMVILSVPNLPTSEDLVSAGVTQNDYVTQYDAYLGSDLLWPSLLIVNGASQGPVNFGAAATYWYWDPLNHKLVNTHAGVGIFEPVAGDVVTIAYNVRTIVADSGDTPLVQYLLDGSLVTSIASGQGVADGALAQIHRNPRVFHVTSKDYGFDVGQSLSVDLPTTRLISSAFFNITTLTGSRDADGSRWLYNFDSEEAFLLNYVTQGSSLNDWRVLVGGSASGQLVGGGGGGGTTTVATWVNIGGSRTVSVAPNPAAWITVSDIGWIPSVDGSYRVWVNLWSRNAGIGVTTRLYDETTATAVSPTSTEESGTTPQRTFFLVTLTAGHIYVMQTKPTSFTSPATTVDGQGVFSPGYIEGA